MAFFEVKKENVKDFGGGGSNINESGMYDIKIDRVEFSKKGASKIDCLDIAYDLNGAKGYLFGIWLKKKDGSPSEVGVQLLSNLLVIAGIKTLDNPAKVKFEKRDGSQKEVYAFSQLAGKELTVQVQVQYGKYNGQITKNIQIKNFFRTSDKASAAEILAGDSSKFGNRYNASLEYSKQNKYNDGVTIAEAKQYEAANSSSSRKELKEVDLGSEDDSNEIPF